MPAGVWMMSTCSSWTRLLRLSRWQSSRTWKSTNPRSTSVEERSPWDILLGRQVHTAFWGLNHPKRDKKLNNPDTLGIRLSTLRLPETSSYQTLSSLFTELLWPLGYQTFCPLFWSPFDYRTKSPNLQVNSIHANLANLTNSQITRWLCSHSNLLYISHETIANKECLINIKQVFLLYQPGSLVKPLLISLIPWWGP